jgi:hypothetical protein
VDNTTGGAAVTDDIPASAIERYWSKVEPFTALDACWLWTGKMDGKRQYGVFGYKRENRRYFWPAHRLAYELLIGPIPEGLVIDHLCRNGRCVNPDHLEPVTNQVNLRRGRTGQHWRRTNDAECSNGHDLTGENARVDKRGYVLCRQCSREAVLRRKAQQAA